ncbi:MAG: AraC family transcriptional regulator [Sphaerochaetaceae bacterium]
MIHSLSTLSVNDRQEENIPGFAEDYPYIAFKGEIDKYVDLYVPWHWHQPFEFVVVKKGILELCTQNGNYAVCPGDGYFINTGIMHMNRAFRGERGVSFHTQLFEGDMITGVNRIRNHYVSSVAACGVLDIILFSQNTAAHREILALMETAYSAAKHEESEFEFKIQSLLSQMWYKLYRELRETIAANRNVTRSDAHLIKTMLTYIYSHYSEPITPQMIAGSANLCERMGYRIFRSALGTTPLASLTDHRVNKAIRMLCETDQSILEIAIGCGFSTSSYFGKVFRQKMHCSPTEYRNQKKHEKRL